MMFLNRFLVSRRPNLNYVKEFHSSRRRFGLEEFFDSRNRFKVRENPVAGRGWEASELRRKSFDDLHKLWFVLYKERNVLLTETQRARRNNLRIKFPQRKHHVRKSMARIKRVLSERRAAYRRSLAQEKEDEEKYDSPPNSST
mmetsp:Transcript_1049/g.1308  ORF Transcript_1049/g.1308 Transcript_1049/m.1308 type:complete len:143 (+) Transcript_1049:59-487(+)